MSSDARRRDRPALGVAHLRRELRRGRGAASRRLEPERVQESDEVYLLSEESDASVKVRDDLMDVKRLEAVDGNGLEQWRPVLKAAFPLAAADVAAVLDALGAPGPELARETYTLEQLIAEVVRPDCGPRGRRRAQAACPLRVRRLHGRAVGGHGRPAGRRARSPSRRRIPRSCSRPSRELRLADRPNVCLARGLKTLLGLDPVRFAVIDVGTNSVKLHVGERHSGDAWRTVLDRAEVTRLGEGLHEAGALQPEPLRRTADAIVGMVGESRDAGAAEIAAVATAGMRQAENSAELVDGRARALRRRHRGDLRRGGGAARISRRDLGARRRPRARSSSSTPAAAAPSSRSGRRGRSRSGSASTSAPRAYTERFGLDGVVSDDGLAQALEAIAADLARLDGQAAARRARRHGRRPDEPRRRPSRPRDIRPRRRPGNGPRPGRGRSPDRALPDAHRRRAARDRRPAAGESRGDPRRRLHRPHRARQAAVRRAHGQRPRPPPRAARRAVRRDAASPARAAASVPSCLRAERLRHHQTRPTDHDRRRRGSRRRSSPRASPPPRLLRRRHRCAGCRCGCGVHGRQ